MSDSTGPGWRGDIQALRALAVVAVVAFHLGIPGCGRGYLGVDVFFVISGYLIGGRLETMASGGSSGGLAIAGLGRFWRARVARLWPAAVVTLGLTALACTIVLDSHEWREFLWQLAGSAALVANVVLWQQTDYFGGNAATKPLLHFWSLAVEEQFYLVVPLVFFVPSARIRRVLIALTTVLSLGLYLVLAPRSPSAAFYFLPTRGWELGLGVILAMHDLAQFPRALAIARAMRPWAWIALIALVVSGAVLDDTTTMLLSTGLAALLVAVPPQAARVPGWLTAIGDRSYAIYLVHWPIIALAANVWMRGPPPPVRAGLLVLIILAAEALWRGVDGRDRSRRRAIPLLLAQGLLMAAALLALALTPQTRDQAFREPNEGLGLACNPAGTFDLARACRSGAGADTVVWGDSFAMQLVPGLAATVRPGVIQATRVVCAPIAGLAPIGPGYSRDWAARCLGWNDAVLSAIVRDPAIRVVVMAGIFNQLVDGATPGWRFAVRHGAGQIVVAHQDDAVLTAALLDTISQLQHAGKRVVLYRPQPYPDYDVGRCLSRRIERLPTLGVAVDCGFAHAAQAPAARAVDAYFDALLIHAGTDRTWQVIDPASILCPQGRCLARRDGVLMFADMVHLSQNGSVWLSQKMNMAAIVTGEHKPAEQRKSMNRGR